jgi:hypothetical protein
LTRGYDDEITGFKEELREEGYPEANITRAAREAQEIIENEAIPPDVEGIKRETSPEGLPGQPTGQPATKLIPKLSFIFTPWKHKTTVVG